MKLWIATASAAITATFMMSTPAAAVIYCNSNGSCVNRDKCPDSLAGGTCTEGTLAIRNKGDKAGSSTGADRAITNQQKMKTNKLAPKE